MVDRPAKAGATSEDELVAQVVIACDEADQLEQAQALQVAVGPGPRLRPVRLQLATRARGAAVVPASDKTVTSPFRPMV